jgi:undecaprenyl-phosphate 4-deoxy-4-formamido-L-arabinose transferase
LRIGTITGVIFSAVAVVTLLFVLVEALTTNTPHQGWASMMAGMLLLAGVQLMMLGIMGEYLGRLFLTANKKPQYVIRTIERNLKAIKD